MAQQGPEYLRFPKKNKIYYILFYQLTKAIIIWNNLRGNKKRNG